MRHNHAATRTGAIRAIWSSATSTTRTSTPERLPPRPSSAPIGSPDERGPHAANAVALAAHAPSHGRKIRVKFTANRHIENRLPVFRAEDHVYQNKSQRLAHRRDYRSGFQPSTDMGGPASWGFAPCWYSPRLRRSAYAPLKTDHHCSLPVNEREAPLIADGGRQRPAAIGYIVAAASEKAR